MYRKSGFSLVELAIVLVILGLLAGGVLSGQSLIKAASLRATMEQMTDTNRMINVFREKYFGLPGDLNNAQSFWASASNGNGNGIIEAATNDGSHDRAEPDNSMFDGERSQFYRQLGLAGLTTSYDSSATLGKGYPAIKLQPSKGMIVTGKWVESGAGSNMSAQLYATDPIYLYMGVCAPSRLNVDSGYNDCAIFTPEETWNIDTKLDDGKPLSGIIIGESYGTTCVSGTDYALSSTPVGCNILYSLR